MIFAGTVPVSSILTEQTLNKILKRVSSLQGEECANCTGHYKYDVTL
jgi:hypothetical protein